MFATGISPMPDRVRLHYVLEFAGKGKSECLLSTNTSYLLILKIEPREAAMIFSFLVVTKVR